MNVLLVSHLTKTLVSACGLARLLTAVALLFLSMTREVNSSVHHLVLQAHSPSTPTLQTAGSTSSASMESPGRSVQCRNRIWCGWTVYRPRACARMRKLLRW